MVFSLSSRSRDTVPYTACCGEHNLTQIWKSSWSTSMNISLNSPSCNHRLRLFVVLKPNLHWTGECLPIDRTLDSSFDVRPACGTGGPAARLLAVRISPKSERRSLIPRCYDRSRGCHTSPLSLWKIDLAACILH